MTEIKIQQRAGSATLKPADFLKRKMALAGLNATTLAKDLEVHVQTIYNVTTGKRTISPSLALKLSKRFVEPVDVWLADEMQTPELETAVPVRAAPLKRGAAPEAIPLVSAASDDGGGVGGRDRILVDYEIKNLLASYDSPVTIKPYNSSQVQPASYDLTVGLVVERGFRELSEHEWVLVLKRAYEASGKRDPDHLDRKLEEKCDLIKFSTQLKIAPHESVIVIARELVDFRKEFLAEVGGTASNAVRGLQVIHGFQIDPGFSGPIIVTAVNFSREDLHLAEGDKLVSLVIRCLERPPEKAYQDDIARRVAAVSQRVLDALKTLFESEPLMDGTFQARATLFDGTYVSSSADDALNRAVSATLETLERGPSRDSEHLLLEAEVQKIINRVPIGRPEAKALIRFFAVNDKEVETRALSHFASADDRQTLGDTLRRLDQDAIRALLDMTEA